MTLERGETPVRIVLSEESPHDLIKCFEPFFSQFVTMKLHAKLNLPKFPVLVRRRGNYKNSSLDRMA